MLVLTLHVNRSRELFTMATVKRGVERILPSVYDNIYKCSFQTQIGVSLKLMMDFGEFPTENNLLIAAKFLHKELPIKLAHKVIELDNLPFGLSSQAPVLKVKDWYINSFKEIHDFPEIKTSTDEIKFTELISSIKQRHNYVLPTLSLAIQELKKEAEPPEIQHFLDKFYSSRIGIRMLIGQHVALHKKNPPDYIGLISTRVSPVEVARNAANDAKSMFLRMYGGSPDINVSGDPNLTFTYVPTHLHWMAFELLKNSLRAVHERYIYRQCPPVNVTIAGGHEDVTIKISDEGGGIPRSGLTKIWSYFYSTGDIPAVEEDTLQDDARNAKAGYGYGLPVTRLYARFFGGDLQVISMEGYGTEAYLQLDRIKTM